MSLKLQSSDYVEVEFAPLAAISKGAIVEAATFGGSLCGFPAFADVALGIPGAFVVKASNVQATKVPGDALAFAPGEKVYYNVAGAKVSKTASDVLIGHAKRAAIAADVVVHVNFDGALDAQENALGALTLAGLADVNVAGADDNDTIKFVQGTGKWTKVAV